MPESLQQKLTRLHLDWIIPDWPAPPHVVALSTTRQGPTQINTAHGFDLGSGFNFHQCAAINFGDNVGEDGLVVAANRALLGRLVGVKPLWLKQVHGTCLLQVDSLLHSGRGNGSMFWEEADGAISCTVGIAPTICTADCLPVLFCNRAGTMVAAVHAGWRGLAGDIIAKAVAAMPENPKELLVWLGPAITAPYFEVGQEVYNAFVPRYRDAQLAFQRSVKPQHWQANLRLLAEQQLRRSGVEAIYGKELCTYGNPQRFYSHRRSQVVGSQGRLASIIGLTG